MSRLLCQLSYTALRAQTRIQADDQLTSGPIAAPPLSPSEPLYGIEP